MGLETLQPPSVGQTRTPPAKPHPSRPRWKILLFFLLGVCGIAVVYFLLHWPFTKEKITADLQHHFPGPVQIRALRRIYLPKPGCVAEGVTIQGISKDPAHPMVTIDALTVRAAYSSIFAVSKRVEMEAAGLHVWIPTAAERGSGLSSG